MAIDPIRPTVEEIAALLRARTKDLAGQEVGTFTPDTRPTDAGAEAAIDMAYAEVTGETGPTYGDRCAGMARTLITIRAAMWIEISYFPEQVRSDRSIYGELSEQWSAGRESLTACVSGNLPGDGSGESAVRFGSLEIRGWTAAGSYPATP
jgi:hypothetical protein